MAKAKVTKKTSTPKATDNGKNVRAEDPTPTGDGWFRKGSEGLAKKHQLDKLANLRKEKGVPRFYLKHRPGDSGKDNNARIVFLDSEGFYLYEHNLKIDGRWGNYFTCVKDVAPCPICTETGDKPVYTCYYTVVDTRSFVRKDGTVSERRKVLFPGKGAAIDIIDSIRSKCKGDLRGVVVDAKRVGDRDPNCGRDFEIVMTKDGRIGRIDPLKKFGKELADKFDYMKIFAPPTKAELVAAGVSAMGGVGSDDDVDLEDEGATTNVEEDEDLGSLLGD